MILLKTLKKNEDFFYIIKNGRWRKLKTFVVYWVPAEEKVFGFAASKKLKTKVKKNRVKRRLRELVRLHLDQFPPGRYVLMGSPATLKARWQDLQQDLKTFLEKVGKS